ncbi:MAG: FAD-dependent oxidoreductase [Saccharofermentans sp.]|nr:FAD-dependent oxidoreductase [Saccharofermentans sp.]
MLELKFTPKEGSGYISDTDKVKAALKSIPKDKRIVIRKKFVDARKGNAKLIYRVDFCTDSELDKEKKEIYGKALPFDGKVSSENRTRPVIVGFGPAGIFAALILARYGLKPIVIERGPDMETRVGDVERFRAGKCPVDPGSNVQFGEGGAGTFSDGKLYTGVNSGLIAFVSDTFVKHGACEDICYDSHPHIGTDMLRDIIVSIRKEIISLGGTVMFNTRLTEIVSDNGCVKGINAEENGKNVSFSCEHVILATGHSCRDTFRYLDSSGITMQPKPFAVGVRIEHKRRDIDIAQYGIDSAETGDISAANYKLAVDTKTGRKLYTFCMCPGGEVICASSGEDQAVVNGMSYHGRDGENSNTALLVPVNCDDYGSGVLDGILFQEELERRAFAGGGSDGHIPASRYGDLKAGRITEEFGRIRPSVKPGCRPADIRSILGDCITDTIVDGIELMGRKIKGFDDPDSVISAVESRSSSPVRILRDRETYQSVSLKGLYPAGEGAGYAGGIMSSAIDGINCANSVAKCYII